MVFEISPISAPFSNIPGAEHFVYRYTFRTCWSGSKKWINLMNGKPYYMITSIVLNLINLSLSMKYLRAEASNYLVRFKILLS